MTNDLSIESVPRPGLAKVKFWGGIQVDPNGTYYITHNPDEPRFVGQPSPEIDDAWQRAILHSRERCNDLSYHDQSDELFTGYVGLTPEEAANEGFDIKEEDWILDKYWVA